MRTMHRPTLLVAACLSLTVVACAKTDTRAADSGAVTGDSAAGAMAPAAIALADVAGKWNFTSVPVAGDTTKTSYVITAKAEPAGWTITFPGRDPVPMEVTVDGDSINAHAGPYDSVRRKGTKVTTNSTFRLEGGKLVGRTSAHYATDKADSVIWLRSEGTRAP